MFGYQVLFAANDGVHGIELWSITTGLGARIDARLARLYQAAYGRTPDPTGLDYWADRHRNGTSFVQIARSFLASAEFVARIGDQPTNPEFVDHLYQNVLGHTADQASRTYWTSRLNNGTSRAEVLIAFSESPTNVARTNTIAAFTSTQAKVVRLYGAAFGRIPDIAGSAFWTNVLDNGASLTSITTQFRASPEFAERYGPDTSNEAFVRLLYTNVLDRAPDPAGLAFWLAQLDITFTRDQVLVAFSESPENIERTSTTR